MSTGDSEHVDVADFLRHVATTRRGALKAALGLGATVLGGDLLAACGGSGGQQAKNYHVPKGKTVTTGTPVPMPSAPTTGAVIPAPRHETVIVDQVVMTAYGSYNPLIPNGWDYQGGHEQVGTEAPFYLNLATGEVIKGQANSWSYNSDFTACTLHLNPNCKWNDGQPLTSADVKFTLELLKDNAGLLANGLMIQQIQSVTTPDAQTATVNLNTRNTRYHYHFINVTPPPDFMILPAHIWSKHDPTQFTNDPPVFSGPYKLKEANRTLQYYLWEKDPNYWNKANYNPKPKYFAVRSGPSATDAKAAEFKEAKYDQGAPYVTTKALVDSGYKKALITGMIDPCVRSIQINCDPSRGITSDPRFRAAVSALIDRQTAAKDIWAPPTTPAVFPWAAYAGLKKWQDQSIANQYQLTYDPTKAAQMLDAMGATKDSSGKRTWQGKPISLTMITPTGVTGSEYLIGQNLQKELQKQGIDCNLQSLSGAVFNNEQNLGQYDLISQWGPCSVFDPYQSYSLVSGSDYVPIGQPALNGDQQRLKDPTLDQLVNQLGNDSPDSSKAAPVFNQALNQWFKDMAIIPTVQTLYTHQANTTYWTGWPTDNNLYIQPNNWWASFRFVVQKLKPTGAV